MIIHLRYLPVLFHAFDSAKFYCDTRDWKQYQRLIWARYFGNWERGNLEIGTLKTGIFIQNFSTVNTRKWLLVNLETRIEGNLGLRNLDTKVYPETVVRITSCSYQGSLKDWLLGKFTWDWIAWAKQFYGNQEVWTVL